MLLIWRRWRGWRRGRPFWGGLFTVVSGVEIGVLPLAPMKVMLHQGTAGVPTVVLAAIMVVLGFSGWFSPQYRGLAGIITVILASAALVLSNLGGFMIGTLLGVVGGALMFAWRPLPAQPPGETEADGSAGNAGDAVFAETAAQSVAFHSEAPASVSSRTSGTAGAAGDPGTAAGSAVPAPRPSSAPEPRPGSGDSSLAAAFGVDDDPFPPPRGDAPRGRGQD
ncbi:DUF6114 domain-containing protein [Streptomyces sp. HNM0575]|uniref:DUF6114 domain-containing protein n=1 Tax=Streptomyces sp. HNM0575 TaxID=2716338 RepID=UPI0019CFF04A|nr:DUF6114 domain-containing protein [Streptomyces sp. HNM0575]